MINQKNTNERERCDNLAAVVGNETLPFVHTSFWLKFYSWDNFVITCKTSLICLCVPVIKFSEWCIAEGIYLKLHDDGVELM